MMGSSAIAAVRLSAQGGIVLGDGGRNEDNVDTSQIKDSKSIGGVVCTVQNENARS